MDHQPDVDAIANINEAALAASATASFHQDAFVGEIQPERFARFLAKIAYPFAVAEKGNSAFEPLILPLLFGKTKIFSNLVGGDYDIPAPMTDEVHFLQNNVFDTNVTKFHYVTIRLFVNLGTPIYHIVVGRS